MSQVDFSLPLATLLRESTHEAHELVAKSPGAMALLSGRLHREEYIRYLMMLWHIYNAFEQVLDDHATHPALEPTYNPTLLARAPTLAADISFLLEVPEASWQSHPAHLKLLQATPPELTSYVSRIREVASSGDPTPLLAHSYVRYLGDLSGGQIVRRTLGKAYGLDEGVGQGLSFYAFKELHSAKLANQGEMKRIKEWFREGMNKAGERGVDVKAAVLAEANGAFDLNTALFTTIDFTAVDPEDKEADEIPRIAQGTSTEEKYTVSQVAYVILAVCLAHFVIVVGGLSGERGYQKLLAIGQWFSQLTESVPRTE